VSSGVAAAHGGEDLAGRPARALVQQALGLLTQQDDAVEAAERREAATASGNREDADIDAVEKAGRYGGGDRADERGAGLRPMAGLLR
jgi:hypothetical protein